MERMKLDIQLFAVTGWHLYLEEVSYDTTNNSSQVRIYATITTTGGSMNYYNPSGTYIIDGATSDFSHNINQNATTILFDDVYTVPHNADGSKTVNASFTFNTGISAGTISDSTSLKLTDIPRKAQIDNISVDLAETGTLSVYGVPSSFTYKWYYVNNGTEYLIGEGASPISYDISATNIPYLMPNSASATFEQRLYTYSGSTNLGYTASTLTVTASQATCGTVINEFSVLDANDATYALTGNRATAIAYASDMEVTLKSYEIYKGASLASFSSWYYWSNQKGLGVIRLAYNTDDSPLRFKLPPADYKAKSGETTSSPKFYLTLLDSRGLAPKNGANLEGIGWSTIEYDFGNNFVYYEYPAFNAKTQVSRPSQFSSDVKLGVDLTYWKGNFGKTNNAITLNWRVKEGDGDYSTWQTISSSSLMEVALENDTVQLLTTSDGSTYSQISVTNPLSDDGAWGGLSTYTFEFKVEDKVTATQSSPITVTKTLLQTTPIYDYWQTRDGNRFFNVNGNLLFNNQTTYSLTEHKTGKTWTDGRPIYSKVIYISNLPLANTWKDFNLSTFGVTDAASLWFVSKKMERESDVWEDLDSSGSRTQYNSSKQLISLYLDMRGLRVEIVIEYTKTTD